MTKGFFVRSYYLIYLEEKPSLAGKALLMTDIETLSLIYGASGILGTAYLCIAMSSGLIAHKHQGHGSAHHGGHHGANHGSGHQAGDHGSHHGSGHHGQSHGDGGTSIPTGDAPATGQASPGLSGRVLGKIEHSAHMHLPHFHTHAAWPVVVDYFNPTSVAIMLSLGGMVGFLCLQINSFPKLLSLPCAIIVGLIARKVFFKLLEKFSEVATVSSAVRTETAIGGEATVCLPIVSGKTGEVYYEIGGKRFNSSARAQDENASFARGQRVWVTDIKEGVFIVMDVATDKSSCEA